MWAAKAKQVSWCAEMKKMGAHYPISIFLQKLIDECGGSPADLITTLGYRNLERGLRRLQPWLDDGEGFQRIIGQIGRHFHSRGTDLNRALYQTMEMKDAEAEEAFRARCEAEKDTFVPYVYAQGELRIPNGIGIYGATGGARRWNIIPVPNDLLRLDLHAQLAALPAQMMEYKKRYRGAVPFFGKLVGFKYVRLLDYFEFDPDGHLVEHVNRPFRHGDAWVSLR
jgi:hypothetical protein